MKNIVNLNYKFSVDTLWNVITKFFVIFLKASISIVTARLLGPFERGIFFAIVQITGLVNTILTFSLGEGIIYSLSKQKKYIYILGNTLISCVFFTFVIFIFLYVFEDFIRGNFLKNISDEIYYFIYFLIPLMMFEYFSSSNLRGLKLFTLSNKISIISRLIILFSLSLAFLLFQVNIFTALVAYTLSLFFIFLVYLFFLYTYSEKKFNININYQLKSFKFSSKIHLATLLSETEYRIDIFIILFFLSYEVLGIYSIGVATAQIVWYVSNSVNTVLFPYLLGKKSRIDQLEMIDKVIKYNFVINAYIVIALIFLGYYLIPIIYGSSYESAYYVFLILVPGLLFDTIARNIFVFFKSINKPLILSKISIATLLINVILNIILIPKFGMYGAALSSLISYIMRGVLAIFIYNYLSKNKFKLLSLLTDFYSVTIKIINQSKRINLRR